MDSTLLDMEVIDELARLAHVSREVSRVTRKAMRGDFDFEESILQRVALLKGLTIEDLSGVRANLKLSEGAEALTTTLRWLGYKIGIISGGLDTCGCLLESCGRFCHMRNCQAILMVIKKMIRL